MAKIFCMAVNKMHELLNIDFINLTFPIVFINLNLNLTKEFKFSGPNLHNISTIKILLKGSGKWGCSTRIREASGLTLEHKYSRY